MVVRRTICKAPQSFEKEIRRIVIPRVVEESICTLVRGENGATENRSLSLVPYPLSLFPDF